MAILGLIAATSTPWLISYWRAATIRAGAQELAAGLNRGRQLAIAKGRSICVQVQSAQYRYCIGGCSVCTAWTGPGTDANGFFKLGNKVTVTANAEPMFDYLGAAVPGATFTVTNPQGGATLSVVVSASGRVQVQ